jgi:cobalamin-dependent methionine synthase I
MVDRVSSPFLDVLADRVLVVDGAMGTMLQAQDLGLDDFAGLEGCNEILNVTRPDVVGAVHRGYLAAGADAVETNTFGANLANLSEYGIADRIRELSEVGARLARQAADEFSEPGRPRFVIGSVGPGTKLPTLGHAPFTALRDAYVEQVRGLLDGGVDAVMVETRQDILQAKATVIGARLAMAAAGRRVALITQVTVETTGTMLLGTEIGAAVVALTIDEQGQARTAEHKVAIADRLIADITGKYGLAESDVIVDTLTFTIATGQEESRRDALETIAAIRALKKAHPKVQTTFGLSNVSFGLNPAARQVLNSVFLHECVQAGLDTAIVHASKIVPTSRIPPEQPVVAARSDVPTDMPVPAPPFWGNRVVKGIAVADYAAMVDERATFMGQWGLRGARGGTGPSYEELVETEGRPRLRYWLDRLATDGVLSAAALVYGYFPCVADGDDLVILSEPAPDAAEVTRLTFPRQRRDRRLCLADFFRPREQGEVDVVAFHLCTMGRPIADYAQELFAADAYRDYLEVHGLGVQLTEALAEYWHRRIREELRLPNGIPLSDEDPADVADYFTLGYRGARFSLGYGACPELADRTKITRLLEPERIGVKLSEEYQLHPEQSTDAIIVHHPAAKYFNV